MNVPKHTEELQRLVFLFIYRRRNSLNALYAYNPMPIACDFLDFMDRDRTVLLQYFSQLINISRTHIFI